MENSRRRIWITPFMRQVFVVLGASLNMGQLSLVVGFTARLLPQLRRPDSTIPVDDSSASWIASTMGVSLVVGNLAVVPVMGRYGRRLAGIASNLMNLIGWIWLSFATTANSIIFARTLQGFALGFVTCVSPIAIGEYSCPANRAAFSGLLVLILSFQAMFIHTVGSYLSWQVTTIIATGVTVANLIILLFSPESPCWLADQGRYEECRKIFRSLRGANADDELEKLIEGSKINKNSKLRNSSLPKNKVNSNFMTWLQMIKLREFYIPVIIMFNIHTLGQWSGLAIIVGFTQDIFYCLVGPDADFGLQILLVDITRMITSVIGIYIAKKLRRRLLLWTTIGANVVVLLLISLYSYVKVNEMLPFDSPFIGISLAHGLMVTLALGASPISVIISAEIFPLKFKSLVGGLCTTLLSINFFGATKTFVFFLNILGLHGSCFLYAIITSVCLALTLIFLPETKDRTLQEIENEFKSKKQILEANEPTCLLTTKTTTEE